MNKQSIIDQALKESGIKFINNRSEIFRMLGFRAIGINGAYINPDTNPGIECKETILITLSENSYYYISCFFHELVHSTGRMGRLNRDLPEPTNESMEIVIQEELIAEKGAMILMDKFGLQSSECLMRNENYIALYLHHLEEGKKAGIIGIADKKAAEAVDYILINWLKDHTLQKTA